jgi:hypothetical protein
LPEPVPDPAFTPANGLAQASEALEPQDRIERLQLTFRHTATPSCHPAERRKKDKINAI